MFTGIIETLATIEAIRPDRTNITFWLSSGITSELKIDQSVAHNGVCLTVVAIEGNRYAVTAIDETLQKTNLQHWTIGQKVNIERCMPASGRFDGHIVQGHVDTVATCTLVEDRQGSWLYKFEYNRDSNHITVEKGSICVNGVSLTVVNSGECTFQVAIIPYTYEHTNFYQIQSGHNVNLEFDIVGKYIRKMLGGITH